MDDEQRYRAVHSRDSRFDGVFYTAVRTTGIYCRPSCPAVTPRRENVCFYRTAAAAQESGYRACKRCRPDTVPGSPEWNVRADVVGRAIRLIHDGAVTRGEKLTFIKDSAVALDNLRVCFQVGHDRVNCGECEKCLRTMVGLYLEGALERCTTLPDEIPLDKLASGPVIRVAMAFREAFWEKRHPGVAFFHSPASAFPTFWTPLPMHAPLLSLPTRGSNGSGYREGQAALKSPFRAVPRRHSKVSGRT